MRFAGSTMDYSALYRLHAVYQLFDEHALSVAKIDRFIKQRQQQFLAHIDQLNHPLINRERLIYQDLACHGHFYAFGLDSEAQVGALSAHLKNNKIITDGRGRRLRFGFALYHDGLEYDLRCLKDF